MGQLNGCLGADDFYVKIKIVVTFFTASPSESDLSAVRRKGGTDFEPRIGCQRNNRESRQSGRSACAPKRKCNPTQREGSESNQTDFPQKTRRRIAMSLRCEGR